MEKNLTKGDLDKFTSDIWYSNFESGEDCFEHVSFYSVIKDELKEPRYWHYGLSEISDKIVRALCYIYNRKMNHQNDFDKDRCSYLYYWLGEKIYSRVHDKTMFSTIINMIYEEIYSTHFLNTCKVLYEDIDKDAFNTYKILHDYSKDYVNIQLKTLSGDITCDEEYKKAIYKYIDTYKEVYSKCKVEKTDKYNCVYFDSLFGNKTYQDLTSYTCKKAQNRTLLASMKARDSPDVHLSTKLFSSEGSSGSIPHRDENKFTTPDHYYTPTNSALPGYNELDGTHTLPTDETSKSGSTKTIMGSVVPVLGVSSFSLLLYKVTPVGGFINRFLGRNRNMYNHIEYMDAFNPYREGMDPVDRRMNISYHRL